MPSGSLFALKAEGEPSPSPWSRAVLMALLAAAEGFLQAPKKEDIAVLPIRAFLVGGLTPKASAEVRLRSVGLPSRASTLGLPVLWCPFLDLNVSTVTALLGQRDFS